MIAFAPSVPFITDLVAGNAETGWQPIRCFCLWTSASVTHQQPIRCLQSGKTLLTRVETSSAGCWPFISAARVSDHGDERPAQAWKPHPATWKECLCFAFVQEGYGFWCCLCVCSALLASEAALSSISETPTALCGIDLLAAIFSGECTAMPLLKAGTHCAFQEMFFCSSH